MKNKFLLTLALLLAGISLQAQTSLSKFKTVPHVAVNMPLLGDNSSMTGAKFTVNNLLKTPLSLSLEDKDIQYLSADSTGYVSLPKANEGNLFYLLETTLRADRFTHSALKIISSARCEVYVNGRMQQSNPAPSDTITRIKIIGIGNTLHFCDSLRFACFWF